MQKVNLPAPMHLRFQRLRDRLLDVIDGRPVYYHPNHGNWGDGLIMAGTRRFLADAGIPFREIHYEELRFPKFLRRPSWLPDVDREHGVLLYGGGGGWCKRWGIAPYLGRIAPFFNQTIVLPSTYEFSPELPNAVLFCRDDFESRQITRAEFCDDMAFYLGTRVATPGKGEGWFLRTDEESAGKLPIPDNNRDLSREHDYRYPAEGFFEALAPFKLVHTDRLHVAIASCLLQKTVCLHPGDWFKNLAVFRSSMQGLFPLAHFVGSRPG